MVREGVKHVLRFAWLLLLVLAPGCSPPSAIPSPSARQDPAAPPPAPREFRGVWIASVANIDWPSIRGLPVAAQQAEALAIVAKARDLGLNALVLQVRPAADALYDSGLEPWSEYLSGEQGKAPEPYYDPLAFWIDAAHRSGLELHAWFNPYRARHATAKSPLAPNHLANTRPAWVKAYGDLLWLDPGEAGAADHSLAVILDVVRRYDLDGVHIDDYFYPYPINAPQGGREPFPDEPSWQAYLSGGGTLSRADWRRSNVDAFVERMHREVHRLKPQVRVGVSPFGVGRPDLRPAGITGFSQYDEIYANVELWLERGWMDYLAPQLYWPRDSVGQPFQPLFEYWRGRNTMGRHVWPGLFTSRMGPPNPWAPDEIAGQIAITRQVPVSTGHIHFSAVALMKDYGGVAGSVASTCEEAALAPASPWLGEPAPAAPQPRLRADPGDPSRIQVESGSAAWKLAVWGRYGGTWRFFALPVAGGTIPARRAEGPLELAVLSAVSRSGMESPRVTARIEGS